MIRRSCNQSLPVFARSVFWASQLVTGEYTHHKNRWLYSNPTHPTGWEYGWMTCDSCMNHPRPRTWSQGQEPDKFLSPQKIGAISMGPLGPSRNPRSLRSLRSLLGIMAWNIRHLNLDRWLVQTRMPFLGRNRGFPRKLCLISGRSFSTLSGGHWASFSQL